MTESPSRRGPAYSRIVLAVLLLVYTFNFIDRIILGILVPPIKAELGLTDTQLGLLGGTAFALFYTALGIPIGWLADRFSRVWIMTVALALWSAFTAACGLAHGFLQLFLCRLGVGIGEAGGVAPAYSLIADYFPPQQRARALGVYAFGIPVGSGLGLFFGGYIATAIDWRAAFFIVGGAGILLAPLMKSIVQEPTRGGLDGAVSQDAGPGSGRPAGAGAPALREVFAVLATKPAFWWLSLASAASSIMGYGLFFWLPSLFVRSYQMSLVQVSIFYGGVTLVGGVLGIWLGGWLADRYGGRSKAAYAIVPAASLLLSMPFYIVGAMLDSLSWAFAIFVIPAALSLAWLGPVTAAVQHLVPANMRAIASAVFLFINNLIGLGCGTLIIGALSDGMAARFGADSLRYAIVAGTGFYLLSAILFLQAARHISRDWQTTDSPAPVG